MYRGLISNKHILEALILKFNCIFIILNQMSQSIKTVAQIYQAKVQQKIDQSTQYLNALQRILQCKAQNFFDTRHGFGGETGIIISQLKLRKSHILATNYNNRAFEGNIREDLGNHLDEQFLLGLIDTVEKRIILVRENQKYKQFRGQLLVLSKERKEQSDRPLLLRLDYSIVHEKVNYPSLKDEVNELFLLAYTLSTIKKEVFTADDISSYISDGFSILSQFPSEKVTVKSLIHRISEAKELSLKRHTFLYKGLEKEKLIYDKEASSESEKKIQKLQTLNEVLVLIHTKWEDGSECFGTGFLFNHQAVITAAKNVTERDGFAVKNIYVSVNPTAGKIEWVQVNKRHIIVFQDSALIKLPSTIEIDKREPLNIRGYSQGLPEYVNSIYVYGYRFFKNKDGTLSFHSTLTISPIKGKNSFDSYFDVESKGSVGSLVFFVSNFEATVFGVYNPLNRGVFNFSLFHGKISQKIQAALQGQNYSQQAIIGKQDQRIKVPLDKLNSLPYSAIGLIYAEQKVYDFDKKLLKRTAGSGTGTFITPHLILTCAHNVLGEYYQNQQLVGTFIAYQIRFYPGFYKQYEHDDEDSLKRILDQSNFRYYQIKSQDIYITEPYKQSFLSYNQGRLNADIAVIHFKYGIHPAALSIKSVPKENSTFWDTHQSLYICGYPKETKGTMREASGTGIVDDNKIQQIKGQKAIPNMLYYQIDTTVGNSGSAITYKNQKNKYQIVAVHTQGLSNKDTGQGIINYGPLLVGQNLRFVQQKINTLDKKIRSASLNLKEHQKSFRLF